jgi:hypothetical protein
MSAHQFIDWTAMPSALGRAAVDLALQLYPVFPLRPGSKLPYRGSRGCLGATTDLETIGRFWTEQPESNIGIATGESGVYVVDLDGDEAEAEWTRLTDGRPIRWTVEVKTRRGRHLWLIDLSKAVMPNTTAKLGTGIDTRGYHGYVVAPPSVVDGFRYRFMGEWPLAPVPRWVREAVTPPPAHPRVFRPRLASGQVTREGRGRLAGICRKVAEAPPARGQTPGRRHATLYWAARQTGALIDAGLVSELVGRGELEAAATMWGLTTPWEVRKIAQTIDDGIRKGGAL